MIRYFATQFIVHHLAVVMIFTFVITQIQQREVIQIWAFRIDILNQNKVNRIDILNQNKVNRI